MALGGQVQIASQRARGKKEEEADPARFSFHLRDHSLFGPFTIVQEMEAYALSFVVQLPLGEDIVISLMRIPDVVRSALDGVQAGLDVHIFAADENADLAEDDLGPSFGHFRGPGMNLRPPVTSQSLALGSTDRLVSQRSTSLVGKTWTVVVIANESFSDSKPGLYVSDLLACLA